MIMCGACIKKSQSSKKAKSSTKATATAITSNSGAIKIGGKIYKPKAKT